MKQDWLEETLSKIFVRELMTDDEYCFLCGHPTIEKTQKKFVEHIAKAIRKEILKRLPKEMKSVRGYDFPDGGNIKKMHWAHNQAIKEMKEAIEFTEDLERRG